MEWIRAYLLSIITAAVLCGIVTGLLGKNGTPAAVGKLLCGVFLTLTILKPWASVQIAAVSNYLAAFSEDAELLVASGEENAAQSAAAIIKQQTEAYILDKAASLEVEITVDVKLRDTAPQTPCAVTITGAVSPYAKARLQHILEEDLGIPKEAQQWIG